MEQLISDYGYLAILIGTFLEGETILVLGGFAAQRGYLELEWVIVTAFIGTLIGDQLYYYIGRYKGAAVLSWRPGWKKPARKLFVLLKRHQILLVLGFRFLYGWRTVAPFLFGASRIPPVRFLILNIIGAAVWAISVGMLGYFFGHAVELMLDNIKQYEFMLFGALLLIGAIAWVVSRIRNKDKPENTQ
jgi:membrane protein DedA with SNARE-associated domain